MISVGLKRPCRSYNGVLFRTCVKDFRRSFAKEPAESGRTYEDAIGALNTLQSRFEVLEARRVAGTKPNETSLLEMKDCIRRIGYKDSDFNKLNVVHVAGTKGKGTTCAFVNSILGMYHQKSNKPTRVGLFTSPHLMHVRERIQINSKPISKELFAKYFWEVWNALESTAVREGRDPASKPVYFRYLTLLSMHVFMKEGVDAAVYEVGMGGAFDSTNIFESPAVTGITTLGIDHVHLLGDTIESISWHKAGIFKTGVPAFSVHQVPGAEQVLVQRAAEKNVDLTFVSVNPMLKDVKITPDADYQKGNASLAVALADTVLQKLGHPALQSLAVLPNEVRRGLEEVSWPGRTDIRKDGRNTWYLDGAHTADSLKVAAAWYATQASTASPIRILIFNQQSRDEAFALLTLLQESFAANNVPDFTHVIFCTNVTWRDTGYNLDLLDVNSDTSAVASLSMQMLFAETWMKGNHSLTARIEIMSTIQDAVEYSRALGNEYGAAQILVTGSLRHIGGVLVVLEGEST